MVSSVQMAVSEESLKLYTRSITGPSDPGGELYDWSDGSEFGYDYPKIAKRGFPLKGVFGLKRFQSLMPVKIRDEAELRPVGETPLFESEELKQAFGFFKLKVKDEGANPNLCFKDAEAVIVVSWALANNVDKICVASSGNAALTTAASARNAGIDCTCYVPENTSEGKKSAIKLFGASLVELPGVYEQVYEELAARCADGREKGVNVTGGQTPLRPEANKRIAYEIWEQMNKRVPDVVVAPVGNGGCLSGIYRGFRDLKKLGLTDSIPQMVGVQVKGAAPLAVALDKGVSVVELDFNLIPNSKAEGIVAAACYDLPAAVEAVRATNGYCIEVSEDEIRSALKKTAGKGFVPEPTSATAFAALLHLDCSTDADVVVISTGSGYKDLPEILEMVGNNR